MIRTADDISWKRIGWTFLIAGVLLLCLCYLCSCATQTTQASPVWHDGPVYQIHTPNGVYVGQDVRRASGMVAFYSPVTGYTTVVFAPFSITEYR